MKWYLPFPRRGSCDKAPGRNGGGGGVLTCDEGEEVEEGEEGKERDRSMCYR